MTSLLRFLIRTSLAVLLVLAAAAGAWADELLYASRPNCDKVDLYTIDIQTGAQTFVTNGPLAGIATSAFDEAHHTIFGVEDVWAAAYAAYGLVITPAYYYSDPFIGGINGPAPATVSGPVPDFIDLMKNTNTYFGDWLTVYAPTTERVYTIAALINLDTHEGTLVPNLFDQYAGPQIPGWGAYGTQDFLPPGSNGFCQAATFDPLTGMIFVGLYGGLAVLEPVSGTWQQPIVFTGQPFLPYSMTVDPNTGDLYYTRIRGSLMELRRWDRVTGEHVLVTPLQNANWQIRFADARYARP